MSNNNPINPEIDDKLEMLNSSWLRNIFESVEIADEVRSQQNTRNPGQQDENTERHPFNLNNQPSTGAVPRTASCNGNNIIDNQVVHQSDMFCKFCFKNAEPQLCYKSHNFKNADGKVTCPVLRTYKCPNCGISGDYAHTGKHCPNHPLARSFASAKSSSINTNTSTTTLNYKQENDLCENKKKKQMCKLCFKNKRLKYVYESHTLHNELGKAQCPYLRMLQCPICGATGDEAHTKKYCPKYEYEDVVDELQKD